MFISKVPFEDAVNLQPGEWKVQPPLIGVKNDNEKPQLNLVDPWALEGLAAVLTFGANKYDSWNWAKGIHYSRLVAALERHLGAIKKGEYIDGESGLPHIDHVGCNWMFTSALMKKGTQWDDLPYGPNGVLK